ncbi:Ig domain-containing protein [Argonema antarcticum]|uniref:Ig domain-containing protein n=1 Tax=Argonema antarcticum TaxID=2942763 RepID=UPI002010D0F7|nr:Ig domain-containing protein [Argonema antarcticum]MCL1475965.1 Ig domain-containing protein [Argonema antarcticum A004/B2]
MTGAASNNTPLLDDKINPQRDWRTIPVGQKILTSLYFPPSIELREQNNFTTSWSKTFEIAPGTSQLSFTIDNLSFDTTDTKSIKDAFEAALVDENGNSLVHTVGIGKNAFFNYSEGQSPALATGVTFSNKIVSLNLSALPKKTQATLKLKLVNNDRDINTIARISNLEIKPNSTFSPPVSVPFTSDSTATSKVDFSKLSDVSNSIAATYGQTSFNEDTDILYTDLAVKNAGQYPIKGTLLVGVTNISDPSVRLLNADGTTPAGIYYVDYSKLLASGTLAPTLSTARKTLLFDNPSGVQFTYDLVFLSQVNSDPEFTTNPDIEAIVGKPYIYDADATDADKDSLTYSVLSGPDGLVVDSATGKITWNPTAADIGNHNIIIKVKDNFGGEATQQYNLSTINPPPNRPPLFTSIPIVDAKVNTAYKYEALAKDDDGNQLTFSLVEAPVGMTVNANTGVVTWMPDGNQLGKVNIKLKVEDGVGATAEQAYQILTQIEPGNRAPFILSEPVTQFNIQNGGNSKSGNVSPFSIDLNLTPGAVATKPISLTLPSNDTANATDMVFVVDRSGSMGGEFRWLGNILQDLDQNLQLKGISPNRYGIITYDTTGQFLNVPSAGNYLTINLFGPDNQYIDSRTIYGGEWPDSVPSMTLPTDGNYTLLVTSPYATAPFQYGFQFTANPAVSDISIPSISSETTIQPLQLNTAITGLIGASNEKDIFTFNATAGTTLYYDSLEVDYDGINVSLLSPNGNLIINNSSSDYDIGPITLQETGTYSLIGRSYSQTGDYKFQLKEAGEQQPLSFSTPITNTLNSGFETAFYHLDGTPGQRLYFDSLTNANGSWYLYKPDNQYLSSNSLSGDFEVTLPFEGPYTLLVNGDNTSSNPVPYSFQVLSLPTAPSSDSPPGIALTLNEPVTGSLALANEQDVFTFSGTIGQQIYYDGLAADSSYIYANLVSPSGRTIFSTSANSNAGLHTLQEAGTYRLTHIPHPQLSHINKKPIQ